MSHKLVHYLRNERRRRGLSQDDVAALLGGVWKGRVSRYERGVIPPTGVALEYEAILHKHVADLLAGAYDDARSGVRSRARRLLNSEQPPHTPRQWLRHKTLEQIAA
jgi:transcriptional regulator with XRE-family HTH domain